MMKRFLEFVGYWAFWPLIAHFRKFWHEGHFLTTSGTKRIKERKCFEDSTIVSSRATISEVFKILILLRYPRWSVGQLFLIASLGL